MFWGSIARGTKGPYIFFKKEWGNISLEVYNIYVLSQV